MFASDRNVFTGASPDHFMQAKHSIRTSMPWCRAACHVAATERLSRPRLISFCPSSVPQQFNPRVSFATLMFYWAVSWPSNGISMSFRPSFLASTNCNVCNSCQYQTTRDVPKHLVTSFTPSRRDYCSSFLISRLESTLLQSNAFKTLPHVSRRTQQVRFNVN